MLFGLEDMHKLTGVRLQNNGQLKENMEEISGGNEVYTNLYSGNAAQFYINPAKWSPYGILLKYGAKEGSGDFLFDLYSPSRWQHSAAALEPRPPHRRAVELPLKRLLIHRPQPFQRRIHKLRRASNSASTAIGLPIPRANILADIAAKNLPPHPCHQLLRNRAPCARWSGRRCTASHPSGKAQPAHPSGRPQCSAGKSRSDPAPALRTFFLFDRQRSQQHRQKPKRPQLRMNQAGVLPRPAQPRRRGQRPLHHRPGIHIAPRLKLAPAELRPNPRLQRLQPLLQHLVIVARPPPPFCILPARPRIPRNPSRARIRRLSRERLVAVVARKANHRRTRPWKRNPHPRPQQPAVLALVRSR